MKKIKIPSKLNTLISKLDNIVCAGIALACVAVIIVGSIQFKNGLTNVNSNIEALDTLPYRPLYVSQREVQTYSDKEIRTAWEKQQERLGRNDTSVGRTIAEMSSAASVQPSDPGSLADLVIIGTPTGHKQYCYRTFVADVRIDKVLSPLDSTSKLTSGGRKKTTYKIPSLNLHKEDTIKIYNELAFGQHSMEREVTASPVTKNPYTNCFTPFKTGKQYLFFLNYAPKANATSTSTARFKIVPSLYGRIPISNEKTFEPNIFCKNLPVKNRRRQRSTSSRYQFVRCTR